VKSVFFRIGTGATATRGGTLAPGEIYQVQFQVAVNDPGFGKPVPSIMNIARITATSDAGINFVDDGTAIINPEAGPTPVTLTRFSARFEKENEVRIDWQTTMEINCKEFIVQRSFDGNLFADIQTIAGSGTTNLIHSYSTTDAIFSTVSESIYYRLKQIDLDGKANYSNIIALKIAEANNLFSVFPNPFTTFINIYTECKQTEPATAKIFNVQGKEVFTKQVSFQKGYNEIKITDLPTFCSGTYFLQLVSPTQKMIKKIIK
jgi:hypothetical protein